MYHTPKNTSRPSGVLAQLKKVNGSSANSLSLWAVHFMHMNGQYCCCFWHENIKPVLLSGLSNFDSDKLNWRRFHTSSISQLPTHVCTCYHPVAGTSVWNSPRLPVIDSQTSRISKCETSSVVTLQNVRLKMKTLRTCSLLHQINTSITLLISECKLERSFRTNS